ncbi:right-handed parallel beta-helix repeat-containing protein [Puniceicoccus vermicola]|uniref:Right-handed parallel beta-helix repeat-containing protein n=1 Tax=Puniceicoccus vermicola TaxID=388746 RepID=A0A7X1E6B4_9BACT|nr:right-handed parallel beta-helix repeat-containing protein [Puniceicoccus vermicola]MBC2603951.1 right-handed parallel beta-helix repeat-containing protein [Puniceicoccus vermicola]
MDLMFCCRSFAFLVSSVLAVVSPSPLAADFWVSPLGDDSNPGSESEPFLTLERAKLAVRDLLPTQSQDLHVNLYGGVYRLASPLILTDADSGQNGFDVVYRAVTDEIPVIVGSIPVDGWTLVDSDLGIYGAAVPDGVQSRQFFVNEQRTVRARTIDYPASFVPKFQPDHLPDPTCGNPDRTVPVTGGGGIEYIVDPLNPEAWRDPTTWTNQSQIEAVIITQWKSMRCLIDEVTEDPGILNDNSKLIKMQTPGWWNANMFRNAGDSTKGKGDDPSDVGQPGMWSFFEVTYFENAYQFLNEPGEWYLDETADVIYYIPRVGEDIATIDAELPVIETLIQGHGSDLSPVANVRIENLTFSYSTWLGPSQNGEGYICDQSGFHVTGDSNPTNFSGHVETVTRTPGNLSFRYAHDIEFRNSIFAHLGGVALDFGRGSQNNTVDSNIFTDISSAAIQIGGVQKLDARPENAAGYTSDNAVSNNLITHTGKDYVDAAGIFVGFTERTSILENTITHTPWSAIALGWGWGLLDPFDGSTYVGAPNACPGQWGTFTTLTANRGNRVMNNRIENFIETVWDGGAIYTLGRQGPDLANGMLIEGNVASNKRPDGGGNIFYTDGGSRYITLRNNVSFDNPPGYIDFGQGPLGGSIFQPVALANEMQDVLSLLTDLKISYGSDTGGCRTFGDIHYTENYFGDYQFFDICPYTFDGVKYPTRMTYDLNFFISNESQVPSSILDAAGARLTRSNPEPFKITSITPLPGGSILIDFNAKPGGKYYIQFSEDLMIWETVLPAIYASGWSVQWLDDGPPETQSLPLLDKSRFYRALEVDTAWE